MHVLLRPDSPENAYRGTCRINDTTFRVVKAKCHRDDCDRNQCPDRDAGNTFPISPK